MSRKYVEARNRATAKYTAAHYDTGNYKLPKGTKERIKAQGSTVNGYINRSVLFALDLDENTKMHGLEKGPAESSSMKWYAVPADLVEEMELYGDPISIIFDGIMTILQEYRSGNR